MTASLSIAWRTWHPNRLVSWYLMASYAYYILDKSIMPDAEFDLLCKKLLERMPEVDHPHKSLVDLDSLQAGTGFNLAENTYPEIVKQAAKAAIAVQGWRSG